MSEEKNTKVEKNVLNTNLKRGKKIYFDNDKKTNVRRKEKRKKEEKRNYN